MLDLISEVPELASKFFVDSSYYLNLFKLCMLESQKQLRETNSELLMVANKNTNGKSFVSSIKFPFKRHKSLK